MSSPTPPNSHRANDPRLCIVKRDEKGYGLTVHGTKPVVVQLVRAEGAAWKAGIREHDEILEVNGVSVENMNHGEVVSRIKERNTVEFKVITGSGRRHRNGAQRKRTQQISKTITTTTSYQTVSDPSPADPEKVRELCQQSSDTTRRMLKAAQQNYQELQQQVKTQPDNSDLRESLAKSRQQVELLQRIAEDPGQQPSLRASVSVSDSSASLTSVSSSLVLSPPSSTSPGDSSLRPWVSVAQAASNPPSVVVPVLEEPSVEATTELPLSHAKSCSMPEQSANAAIRPAARSKSDTQEKRRPVSMDVSSLRTPTVVTTPPTTPAPSSSKTFKSVSQPHGIDAAGEDHSGATTPEAISEELPTHRRTNSLEVFGPGASESSPRIAKKTPSPLIIHDPEMEDDEEESKAAELEVKLFSDFDKVLDSAAACSKLISYAFTNSKTPEGETNLHRILFIVVMRDFNQCDHCAEKTDFIKDLRRIIYEIYSTFLALQAPLNVSLSDSIRNDLTEKMRRDDEESSRPQALKNILKSAFVQIKSGCDLLSRFQRDLKNGMDNVLTQSVAALRQRMPKEDQIRFMEQTLGRHCDSVNRWPESIRRSAMASAFATVYKYYQGPDERSFQYNKSMENLALGNAATFNSKLSKSRSVIPNLTGRRKTTFNGHSLSMKTVEVEAYCEYCNMIICGTAPQAEVCHHCGLYFHKECRPQYKKSCDRSKRSSIFSFRQDKAKPKDGFSGSWGGAGPNLLRQSQSLHGLHRVGGKGLPSTSDSSYSVSSEGRERVRKMGSREGSADMPSANASSPASGGAVNRLVEGYEKQNSNVVDDDVPSRTDSDCSQHGDAISEAESMQPGSSSDSIGTSIGGSINYDNEVKEADVRHRLEAEPMLEGLPADVEHFIEDFGFRSYYDKLTREGSRKGSKDLKDYQIACCEMYFQELSHIRNLKIMQYMYVEAWPSGADDLRAAMGLDKLITLIELREELIELLKKRLDMKEKKFDNMGAAYEEWLNETRSVQLKVLLGCIRYKGENHFDKLLKERYNRVGALVERTYNKLNLFDMMISVNQHACRPSLHLSTVKKSLGKLQKAMKDKSSKGEKDVYAKELETWKLAEKRLFEVAGYLNDLKQKVVDLIPKVDSTKLHAMPNRQLPTCYKDIPRTLNCFYFLRDVDCTVRLTQEGKSKDARLLVFEPFCIFLYVDANNPERFVLRQWERIPAVVQFTIVEHVMKDNTTKKSFIIFLDTSEKDRSREEASTRSSRSVNTDIMGVTITVKADDSAVDKLFELFTKQASLNKKSMLDRRIGMGSSMSLSHAPRNYRSGSTASVHSVIPQMESSGSQRGSLKSSVASDETVEEDEIPPAAVRVVDSNRRLLSSIGDYKKDMMKHYNVTDTNFEQMVDVMANNGPRDAIDLHLLLLKHLDQLTTFVAEVGAKNDEGVVEKRKEDWTEKLKDLLGGLETTVKSYTEPPEDPLERTPVNSVFEEVIQPDNRDISVFAEPFLTINNSQEVEEESSDDEVEQGPASLQDEETAKALTSDEEELSGRLTTYSMDVNGGDDDVISVAQRLVQQAFQMAMLVVSQEQEKEANISVLTSG